MNGRGHQGFVRKHAGIVHQVARSKPVAAVDGQIVLIEDLAHIGRTQLDRVRHHADGRIERLETRAPGFGLGSADAGGIEEDLALQIRLIDRIEVHQSQGADAGRGQVQPRGGADAAGADEDHARGLEAPLAFRADLGELQVPAVAPPVGG